MAEIQGRGKPVATPRQLLLVGVLGAILVTVLVVQFGGASNDPTGTEPSDRRRDPPPPAGKVPPENSPRPPSGTGPEVTTPPAKPARPPWPKLSAKVAAEYDPFAVPEPLARRITEGRKAEEDRKARSSAQKRQAGAEKLAALRTQGASAVVQGERGATAVIGNRVVRVGDVVEGYRVVSIDLKGVVLVPDDRRESREAQK